MGDAIQGLKNSSQRPYLLGQGLHYMKNSWAIQNASSEKRNQEKVTVAKSDFPQTDRDVVNFSLPAPWARYHPNDKESKVKSGDCWHQVSKSKRINSPAVLTTRSECKQPPRALENHRDSLLWQRSFSQSRLSGSRWMKFKLTFEVERELPLLRPLLLRWWRITSADPESM